MSTSHPTIASEIDSCRVDTRDVPILVPFTISRESLPKASLAFVTLTDGSGRTGVGEASPFPSLTHDDVPTAVAVARSLAEAVVGQAPAAALTWLAAQRPEAFPRSATGYTAVESALWDLHGRQLGRSLAELWGGAGVASVTTDITLPIMAPAAVLGFCRRFAGHGFPVIKIKVAGHVSSDLDLVHALVAEAAEGTAVTLDGNQGYALDGAKALLTRLLADGIRPLFFEQPLPEDDHAGHAALEAAGLVPVCLDETVRTAADARRAVETRLGSLINVKTMKSGIAEARAIVDAARAGGLGLMIGGMLESEVAMGISLHLACGTGAFTHFDLDTPFFFERPVTRTSPWHARSARLVLPEGAGHGLELVPDVPDAGCTSPSPRT